nr:penicillin-insensitive murein endopeptidase [Pseudomonadota bacterium]
RLKCPAGSSTCVPQEPLPAGDGCDALEWWFTEEALHPKAPIQKIPKLPQACTEVFYTQPRVQLIAPALEGKSRESVK